MARPDEDPTELLQRGFSSLSDSAPDGPRPWSLFGLQALVNMAVVRRVIPAKGITPSTGANPKVQQSFDAARR